MFLKKDKRCLTRSNFSRVFVVSFDLLFTFKPYSKDGNLPRGKNILEQLSKPRIFTEFENRRLFSAATQQGRKGRDFKLRKKSVAFRVVLISLSL